MPSSTYITGLWDGHDSGVCVINDREILYAANEERFSKRKLEVHFPALSLESAVEFLEIDKSLLQCIAVPTSDVSKTIARLFPSTKERYYQIRRRKALPSRMNAISKKAKYKITQLGPNSITARISKSYIAGKLRQLGYTGPDVRLVQHHYAHAASAAFTSGFDSCAVVTLDGIGDGLSGSVYVLKNGSLNHVTSIPGKDSFGIFFEHVTNIMNMRELEDEGKVMALANHTYPLADRDNPMLDLFRIDGMRITCTKGVYELYDHLKNIFWKFPYEQFAYMAQRTLELKVTEFIRNVMKTTGMKCLAISGGLFANIKLNMLLRREKCVDECFVFPHMGDGGLALGAAMALNYEMNGISRYELKSMCLGPAYEDECTRVAQASGLHWKVDKNIEKTAAEHLASGKIILWLQGRMEAGPRALGNRSILASPGSQEITTRLNVLMKKRSWFQPFCPSMLEEAANYFLSDYNGIPNRFMTMGYMTHPDRRAPIAGVLAADGSCRPQIVGDENPRYKKLLSELKELAGHGVVLNTSFNIHGEPIVRTPEDALRALHDSGADYLVMGDTIITGSGNGNV